MWRDTGLLAIGRAQHTATLLASGHVLVVGGRASDTSSAASAELYSPATEVWTPAGSMGLARSFHTATGLGDDRVLIAGGLGAAGATASTELF
ncbi:MAG: kelch repeat-containing protein, partial [Thermoleophilaceae bacterium]